MLVSIIIPALNEEENLPLLKQRLEPVLASRGEDFELIVIDNASTDKTAQVASAFVDHDARWSLIRLARNFGAESSLNVGLFAARGDALIFLFSDLQDPPELIPELLSAWKKGFDVVYGIAQTRADSSFFVSLGARAAYATIRYLSGIGIPENATDYRLLSRRAIEALKLCHERNRYLRGLVHWIGFQQVGIPYNRSPRLHGKTSTSWSFLWNYGVNAVVAFSGKPLRLASFVGLAAMFCSFLGSLAYIALYFAARYKLTSLTPPSAGWTSQMIALLFLGGTQSLCIGVMGRYLSNVYDEVKRRPLWLVAEMKGSIRQGHAEDPALKSIVPF